MNKLTTTLASLVLAVTFGGPATAARYGHGPKAEALITKLHAKYDLDPQWVRSQLAAAKRQPEILQAMRTPPEETLAWYEYRSIFLNQPRIEEGAAFVRKHADIFRRAEKHFGVPPTVIAAIIGVETRYGEVLGEHRVLDALATLGFDYPPRADFFRSELGAFLALAHEENLDPLSVKGSYAGAMGMPQFIPSSYRAYAVDFNHNGQRDLWSEPADVIGSVANYLAVHGWRHDAEVILRAHASNIPKNMELSQRKTHYRYQDLVDAGITTVEPHRLEPGTPVGLVALEGKHGTSTGSA